MKKRNWIRLISLLLSIATLLSLVACDFTLTDPSQTESQTQATAPSQPPSAFVPTSDYVIVYGEYYADIDQIQKACRYLKTALLEVYGITADIVDDTVESTAKKEFLVGRTNRAESKQLAAPLAINDYAYYVASDSTIAICGGIPNATYEGVKKFCADVLTFDGTAVTTPNAEIKVREKYEFYDWYPYDALTINGVLWEDYTLAISNAVDMSGAIEINKRLGQYTGHVLPILHVSEMTGKEKSVIRLGASYRTGTGAKDLNGYLINTYIDDVGSVICFNAANKLNYTKAIDDLFKRIELIREEMSVTVNIDQETVYNVTTTNRDGVSKKQTAYMHWTLDTETSKELSDGVTYVEQLYYDDEGLPYRVYTLIVDTDKNRLDMGTSNDGYDCPLPDPSTRQHTQEHMEAAVKNGENVIAATNADFFNNRTDPAGNYEPWGFTIKDGILISEKQALRPNLTGTTDWNRPFFGVDKNGNPLIAMEDDYLTEQSRATLEMAVGAAYILTENGKTNFYQYQNNIIHGEIHPRTVVGYREDGTVILMVIDGRQEKHSNGASLIQCSLLMQRFEASDSVLLDGGGSSCMVLRDPDTNTYTTANKPSDGKLRRMFNSILVIKK